jgi:hypothetical protein
MFCREWLAQLEQHHEEFAAAGLKVVVVGLGQPKHAAHYGPRRAPHATCLVSDGTAAHEAYGLQRGGLAQLAGPQVMGAGLRATLAGFRQGATTGDARMLSGAFIIDPAGTVRAAFYSDYAGDLPDWNELRRQARLEGRPA